MKALANEWLLFLTCLAVAAFLIVPLFIFLIGGEMMNFYRAITFQSEPEYFWHAFAILLAPYILVQILRSILWAYKTRNMD